MIENKRSYIKKEIKTETRPEPLYTVTSNSGNTVIQKIQRNRRRTSGSLGSLSRLPKTPTVKTEPTENVNMFDDDKAFERTFSVNKKSKMINTYGKSKTSTLPKKTLHYTGSLSDRLQLIDTTPTGEDPYQLGEADMREQSPIPKLMLQKTNHGRMKICSDLTGESTVTSRRIYDAPATETSTKMPNKIKLEKRYNLPNIVPYSASQSTTHTSTHTTQTPTDAGSHMSTYSQVSKPSALTPKQIATLTPKQTSTLTSNACTPISTYSNSTRNASTRTAAASHKAANKGQHKSPSGASRKSLHSAVSKGLQKGVLKNALASPLTTMATLTPLHIVPLSSLQSATPLSLTTPLTPVSVSNTNSEIKKESLETPTSPPLMQQTDLDHVKKEAKLEWPIYSTLHPTRTETSLCDFSYGETQNLTTLPALDVSEFRQLIESEAAAADAANAFENIDNLDYGSTDKIENDKMKKKGARTTSLGPGEDPSDSRRGMGGKRGRKRALSAAGVIKNSKQNLSKPVGTKAKMVKGKAACRGKKSPLPGMMTRKPYHTLVGDPDLSWYLGLDPDVKMEDIDQGDCKASTVEVPRWREKPYTSLYSLEGTENLDDKVFEKRHQKLEAEERRQLRWHMRRIREQRHVERLRMRQRDPWYSGHSHYQPSVYTIWPQPQRDVRMIEITDTIPVMAFGEDLPDLPPADFMLPWVRTSKALKRSKRSKTLH
uniref:PEHE domain-containing protein n=1 Tax=Heliothis virescens TaxID=7102 RepID=A0A2A4IX00_HELVI